MKALITIIVLALVAWAVYALVDREPEVNTPDVTQEENNNGAVGGIELAKREFTVHGKNFSYDVANMKVNEGEMVKITFINDVGTHDLVVDGYNARTKVLQAGQSETIEFLAEKAGTFEYYCSVGTHRQMGMKGTLTVEPFVEQ
jgi:plastocyanin